MEHLLQKSKCSILHNIFKYMIFQRGSLIMRSSNHDFVLFLKVKSTKLIKIHKECTCNTLHTVNSYASSDNIAEIQDMSPHLVCYCKMMSVMALDSVTSFLHWKDITNTCKCMRHSPTIGGISSVQWQKVGRS